MPELQRAQKRQVAVKVTAKDIIYGKYVKEEGWIPNYIEIEGRKVSRVNFIGAIVFKSSEENFSYKSLVIDDGSGKISVRSFEKNDYFSGFDIGDAIMIIGRIREFNNEKYIIPEIARKIQNLMWIKLRKFELNEPKNFEIKTDAGNVNEDKGMQAANEWSNDGPGISGSGSIYNLIKKLDSGDGVLVEDLIKRSDVGGAEKLINGLLENGDIFEVRPGKVKVLE